MGIPLLVKQHLYIEMPLDLQGMGAEGKSTTRIMYISQQCNQIYLYLLANCLTLIYPGNKWTANVMLQEISFLHT